MRTLALLVYLSALLHIVSLQVTAEVPTTSVTSEIVSQGIMRSEFFSLIAIHFRHYDELYVIRRSLDDGMEDMKIEKIEITKADLEKLPALVGADLRSMWLKKVVWSDGFECEIEVEIGDGRFATIPCKWTSETKLKLSETSKWRIELPK